MSTTSALSLEGRIAVVLGGTSGIGRAIAMGLAKAGANVIPSSRRLDAVTETCSQIESLGRRTVMCTSDVLDTPSLEQVRSRFSTPLNEHLLLGTARGKELIMRTPMQRFGEVEELAGAAVYLASDAAGFVTGTTLNVDGGFLASGVNQ